MFGWYRCGRKVHKGLLIAQYDPAFFFFFIQSGKGKKSARVGVYARVIIAPSSL